MIYEIGYLILPTVGEDALAGEVTKIKEVLASIDGKIVSDEYPVLISLQYEMVKRIDTKNTKFSQAYFGWIKFEADGETIEKIKKVLDLNKLMLRYMIISTVRENTLFSKKPFASSVVTRSSRAPKAEMEESVVMDEQAVDQEIDKLVEDLEEAPSVEASEVENPVETELSEDQA